MQLAYQICVQGRADLALAPDEATGFSMTLLRLLAFEPASGGCAGDRVAGARRRSRGRDTATTRARTASGSGRRRQRRPFASGSRAADRQCRRRRAARPRAPPSSAAALAPMQSRLAGVRRRAEAAGRSPRSSRRRPSSKSIAGNVLELALPAAHKHLADKAYSDKLKARARRGDGPQMAAARSRSARRRSASLAAQEKRERAEEKAKTEAAFRDEPFVQDVLARFDATIKPDSIKPHSSVQEHSRP